MRKNRTTVKLPVFVPLPPPLTIVNLIIDRINNQWRGQSRALRADRRDETRRRRAGFANKRKKGEGEQGDLQLRVTLYPLCANERSTEWKSRRRVGSLLVLIFYVSRCSLHRRRKIKEREREQEGMMKEKGVRKRGREHSRLNPAMVQQEIGLGEDRRREKERELIAPRQGRESVTATM